MILAYAGNQLFTVYVDHLDLNRLSKLWKLVDRIEELYYSTSLVQLAPFLSSLGPAPNLKVLFLRPELTEGIEEPTPLISLPTIFSGCLPSLRDLTLTDTPTWPIGLFKGLVSFECDVLGSYSISPVHVLSVLRDSPSITSLRLVGYCTLPQSQEFHSHAVTLPSLEECILVGLGTTSLIQFLTVPSTTRVFLNKSFHEGELFPNFDYLTVAPGFRVLDEVSTVSFSISDHAVQLQAKNVHGGVFDAELDQLYELSQQPVIFPHFVRCSFESGRAFPGFKTATTFTLDVERSRVWEPEEAMNFAFDVTEFIFNLPSIEEVKLRGVPPLDLASILEFPHSATKFKLPCPSIRRLHIVSTHIRSPRPLLEDLGKLLAERKEAGMPFQSVTVKVKCELLIPAPEHRAFLTSWGSLVEEGVSLEYEAAGAKKFPRYQRRNYEGEEELDYEEDELDNGDEDEDKNEDEEGVTGDPDDGCVGWGGWPENWPATVG